MSERQKACASGIGHRALSGKEWKARGHDHAVRILARAWLPIIWHCWQDKQPYQPDQHRALQRVLTQNQEA